MVMNMIILSLNMLVWPLRYCTYVLNTGLLNRVHMIMFGDMVAHNVQKNGNILANYLQKKNL